MCVSLPIQQYSPNFFRWGYIKNPVKNMIRQDFINKKYKKVTL